ncbi:hypothetical protein E1218_24560 [Kribbella turkmenica]|uniref:DUF8129 domain-containing protein n=1 Tax=Kribbella turkmenica TaxID=2530375 RepID=A0A4R4WQM0_9ACTN|nr:hypothetical protein [Kribbella turkmenica]TDD19135.1 hypothetical protein E1218_24560 [Kribbella turkmenica]
MTLPLPEYDNLPLGSLMTRIRSLDSDRLAELIAYEQAHAHRTAVLELLRHRSEELERGAEPTGGDPAAFKPETASTPSPGSKVGPTDGPALNPPAHGDPTNPSQPRD